MSGHNCLASATTCALANRLAKRSPGVAIKNKRELLTPQPLFVHAFPTVTAREATA